MHRQDSGRPGASPAFGELEVLTEERLVAKPIARFTPGARAKAIAEAGLPGRLLRRWELIGASEPPDHVAACREVGRGR